MANTGKVFNDLFNNCGCQIYKNGCQFSAPPGTAAVPASAAAALRAPAARPSARAAVAALSGSPPCPAWPCRRTGAHPPPSCRSASRGLAPGRERTSRREKVGIDRIHMRIRIKCKKIIVSNVLSPYCVKWTCCSVFSETLFVFNFSSLQKKNLGFSVVRSLPRKYWFTFQLLSTYLPRASKIFFLVLCFLSVPAPR